MESHPRLRVALLALALCVLLSILLSASPILAAAPNVRAGSATVDGSSNEWDTSTSGPDFFIYGCPGSDGGNTTGCNDTRKTPTTAWYMRYECHTKTLYVLVLALSGFDIDTTQDQYIKGYPGSNDKLIDKSGSGLTIAFVYVNQSGSTADGWEASGGPIPAGTYTLRPEAHVNGGATSGSGPGGTTVYLASCPDAAHLNSFKGVAGANRIKLKWNTSNELDVLGFNVWRSATRNGTYKQLNPKTIPATKMGLLFGSRYIYKDATAKAGKVYFYKLEIMGANGPVEWSDAIKV